MALTLTNGTCVRRSHKSSLRRLVDSCNFYYLFIILISYIYKLTIKMSSDNINDGRNRRREDWVRKCVSNFSLYGDLVGDKVDDPHEQLQSIKEGDFKPKLSKSAKKRLRRMKKKKQTTAEMFRKIKKTAIDKKIEKIIKLKRSKKDMKIVINKLSNLPL